MQAVVDNDFTNVTSLIKDAKKFCIEEEMINIPNNNGETPLMIASLKNNLPIAKLLIEKGSIVSKKDNDGDTAAHHAALNGSNDVLRHLLISGVNVDERGDGNLTLLHRAACYKYCWYSTVDMLLNEFEGRSFINDISNVYQETPLSIAISKGDLEMVKKLIEAGANKEKVIRDNKTALDWAKKFGKRNIVNYLENM